MQNTRMRIEFARQKMLPASLTYAPGNVSTHRSHRRAYLISSGGERGRSAAALLRSSGFSVTRLPPVVLTPHHFQLLPPRWSSRLASNASGLQWVKRSFSCMLTQRLAYERIARRHAANATDGHLFEYIFEDDVALHPSLTSRALLPPLLDAAESIAHADHSDLVYLGGCRTYRRQPIGRAAVWRVTLSNGTSVETVGFSRCAVMCTHAYGVATATAGGLFRRLSRALGPLFAPAMDQNLWRFVTGFGADGRGPASGAVVAARGASGRRRAAAAAAALDGRHGGGGGDLAPGQGPWPVCIAMGRRVAEPDCCRGLFYQHRARYNSTIHAARPLKKTRRPPSSGESRRRGRRRRKRRQGGSREGPAASASRAGPHEAAMPMAGGRPVRRLSGMGAAPTQTRDAAAGAS